MYDFHVHSSFSGDCKYQMEDMILGAIDKNLKMIAFTDHLDYDYGGNKINFAFTQTDYFKEFKRLKNKYKSQIEVVSGIEVGMQPHLVEKANAFINEKPFDFILMSVHTAKSLELHEGDFFKTRTVTECYSHYYEDIIDILNRYDNFDVIGHLDLIERYQSHMESYLKLDDYHDLMVEVLTKVINMEKGIEINTSGMRYGIDTFHPSMDILKLYKTLGGEIITFGSDAHRPQDLGNYYNEAIALLKGLDFKYICIFKERRKHFIKI